MQGLKVMIFRNGLPLYAAKKRHPDWDLGFTLASVGPVEPPFLQVKRESAARAFPAVPHAPPSFPDEKFLFAQRNVWFPFPSHV